MLDGAWARIRVALPGEISDHNADSIEAGTLLWDLDLESTTYSELTAHSVTASDETSSGNVPCMRSWWGSWRWPVPGSSCGCGSTTPRSSRQAGGIMARTIYLANPYGFSLQQKTALIPPIVDALESLGLEVWEPFSRNNQVDFADSDWAYDVGQADARDVRESDAIFAVVNGVPPDEGVMVELGMAIALGRPTFLFRDDFRRTTDSDRYPLNLMLFTGLPNHGWENCFYTSVEEISNPDKGLARWAGQAT